MIIHKISKVNALFVCIIMMAILLSFNSHAQAAQDGYYTYSVADGQAQVTGYSGHEAEVVIPSNLGGFPVTSIGDNAFRKYPEQWQNFLYELKNVSIPQGITSIGAHAFTYNAGLTSIDIPESVTTIGDYAFMYCTSLPSISLPQGLTAISSGTFLGCSRLTAISIPQTVTSIGNAAFSECTGLTTISLPQELTSISNNTFYYCSSLKSINIPEGVTSIGSAAFMGCSGLTAISIPKGVTSIDPLAFWGCGSLTNITVAVDNLNYLSIDGVLFNKAGTTLIACPGGLTSVSIPEGVTSIGDWAFISCYNLTTISLPQTVTSIGRMAFRACTGLIEISIPQEVTSIGEEAFWECSSLSAITFNSATTTIPDSFYTIPYTTKIIGYDPSTAKDYAAKYGRTFEVITTPLPGPLTVSVKSSYYTGENVLINWTSSTNATKYVVRVYNTNYFSLRTITTTSYNFEPLPIGDYTVDVTPINSDGVEGSTAYAAISVVIPPIPDSTTVSTTKPTYYNNENVVVNWTVSTYASKYRLRVWTNFNNILKIPFIDTIKIPFIDTIETGNSKDIGKFLHGNYQVGITPINTTGAGTTSYTAFSISKLPAPTVLTFPCDQNNVTWTGSIYSGLIANTYGHIGIDYRAFDFNLPGNADKDKPVFTVAEGDVVDVDEGTGTVIIKHTTPLVLKDSSRIYHTWYSKYVHMREIRVNKGDHVYGKRVYSQDKPEKNTNLGLVADVGNIIFLKDNEHLHFAIYTQKNGDNWNQDNNSYTILPSWISGLDKGINYVPLYDSPGVPDAEALRRINEGTDAAPSSN